MSAQAIPQLTPDEYLDIERSAERKSEYYNGRMDAMSGGTHPHAMVICNFAGELRQALKKTSCTVSTTELRLRVSPTGLYTYPDIIVVCGEPSYADDQKDTPLNPAVIVEVLSKSTEAHDRGFKFARYRTLPSLNDYVLVAQDEPRMERYQRQNYDQWLLTEYLSLDAVIDFGGIGGIAIPLSEIYDKTCSGVAPEGSECDHDDRQQDCLSYGPLASDKVRFA